MMTMGIAGVAQAETSAGVNVKDMNQNVKPGDDFYEYAGGGWMKANPLTAETMPVGSGKP